ncbi:unnamed protein product, partial [marine sediment metagenome]
GFDLTLVHGMPILNRPAEHGGGERYGHAWIEIGDHCINVATGREGRFLRDLYYRVGKIREEDCFRYTRKEAMKMMNKFGHYGPWEGPESVPPCDE